MKIDLSRNGYGCEEKPYYMEFYTHFKDKDCSKRVNGIIDNFQPNGQTAIRDKNNDLWIIDSKLIKILRPLNESELKSI